MTKESKVKMFDEELALIPVESVRTWTSRCIELIPDYFFEVGASSTGKHHPRWSKGPGGTYRHTRALVRVAKQVSGTFTLNDGMLLSKIVAAGVLHDSCKYGLTYDVRMYDLHPYLPRALFKRVPYEFADNDREIIFRAIESHMGSVENGGWSLLPYITVENLREDKVAHIVHLSDYIVSREDYVDPRFAECTEDPQTYDIYTDDVICGFFYSRVLNRLGSHKLAALAVGDEMLRTSIIGRVRALKREGDKITSLYNYDDIQKTIAANLDWMEPIIKDIEARGDSNV